MTQVAGPSHSTHTGFIVIDSASAEYPTTLEGRTTSDGKSITDTDSIFDDGTGTLIPGSYFKPLDFFFNQAQTAAATSVESVQLREHDGTTAYPGLTLQSSVLLAGAAGATETSPDGWPFPQYIGRAGLSVITTATTVTGILSYKAYKVRL